MPVNPFSPLHWKPVSAPAPATLRGRYVILEPLNPDLHSPALWEAVRGHDELWTWLAEGIFATEADLRQSIGQKQSATSAVFFAIIPVETAQILPRNPSSINTRDGFVTGHDFSHAETAAESTRALQAAEKLVALKGPGFSRAVSAAESTWALAPEGSSSPMSPEILSSSAACLAPGGSNSGVLPQSPPSSAAPKAAGWASYMRIEPAHGVVEVGNILLSPSLQRTRAATEAMYMMARHVFEDLGYRRYEWKCNALNEPSRRAALRYGFTFEGIFRQHMVIKDLSRDTAWFSMLDHEWPARKRAFEAWLDPANFDGDGNQKQNLTEIATIDSALR